MRAWPARSRRAGLIGRAGLVGLVAAALLGCGGKAGKPGADAGTSAEAARADAAPAAPRLPPRLVITEKRQVDQGLAWDARALPPEAASAALDERLVATPAFQPGAGPAVDARLDWAIGLSYEGEAGAETRADVAVMLRLRWKEGGEARTVETRFIGEQPLDKAARAALAERSKAALARAVGDAVGVLAARDGIRRGDDAAVIAALGHADPDVRAEAYRAVGERKLSAALPRLVELLRADDPEIRDGAIGAMVALGDPAAVKPLVDRVEFKDLDLMRRIIDAVGQIGGDEAEAYLDFVASGHEVPQVRELARAALERLRRKDAGAK